MSKKPFLVIGKIARKYWKGIPQHYPYVDLDECIIMPNHIHGIINITVGAIPCNRPINNIIKNNENHIITGENMVSPLRIITGENMVSPLQLFNKHLWQRSLDSGQGRGPVPTRNLSNLPF